MNLEIKALLTDILEAINSIDDYLEHKRDFNHFMSSKLVKRGIEREFEIIGEAINSILKLKPEIGISSARDIVNLRNKVIHDYRQVDYFILWRIINRDLISLKSEIESILNT